jgi:tryptophan synthase alpha chain
MVMANSEPGAQLISDAIHGASDQPAIIPFLSSGFPDPDRFLDALEAATREAAVCEVGIPFSDPMADGVTIQRTSRIALEHGVSLGSTLEALGAHRDRVHCPILLMSYLNPLLNLGAEKLADSARAAGVSGFIIPDLPVDEDIGFRSILADRGLATVQLVTSLTTAERRARLLSASTGFLYAVTRVGTTGSAVDVGPVTGFLDELRAESSVPVCAGFGIRGPEQVAALRGHADGVIVGSALMEVVEQGGDVGAWLRALK